MSIRTRNIHFTNWAKVVEALADKGITVANEEEARTFLTNTSSDANPYYYYVGYIKATQEIYTHGKFYNCNGGSGTPAASTCTIAAVYNGATQDTTCYVDYTASVCSWSGWTFNGWNSSSTATAGVET